MSLALPPGGAPFDATLGLEYDEVSADAMQAHCAVSERLLQPGGLVHGGVFASIAESLASFGTMLGVAESGNVALGQSNTTSFLRPIGEGTIHAEARPRHRGRSSWIWDVDIRDDAGALCAISRVTVAVRPAPRD